MKLRPLLRILAKHETVHVSEVLNEEPNENSFSRYETAEETFSAVSYYIFRQFQEPASFVENARTPEEHPLPAHESMSEEILQQRASRSNLELYFRLIFSM
jgi:hypothetical protein